MAKKRSNKKAKRRIFLFFIIFGSIIGSLSYSFFSNIDKIMKINEEKKALNNKLSDLKEEEEVLNSDIKRLQDPDYVARYAREKYLYSKEGELIIRIPDDE
ncbi:MAG: septum formation initiator family protein [Bacilli bacterium]